MSSSAKVCEADIANLQIVSLQQWGNLAHTVSNSEQSQLGPLTGDESEPIYEHCDFSCFGTCHSTKTFWLRLNQHFLSKWFAGGGLDHAKLKWSKWRPFKSWSGTSTTCPSLPFVEILVTASHPSTMSQICCYMRHEPMIQGTSMCNSCCEASKFLVASQTTVIHASVWESCIVRTGQVQSDWLTSWQSSCLARLADLWRPLHESMGWHWRNLKSGKRVKTQLQTVAVIKLQHMRPAVLYCHCAGVNLFKTKIHVGLPAWNASNLWQPILWNVSE